MIKAVIVDLDGTLLRKDQSVSEFTLGTLRKCREKGIKVMVATARPRRNALMYTDIIDFDAMTFSNGARVICGGNMTDIDVPFDKVAQTLDTLSAFENMRITLETGDNAFSNRFVGDFPTVVVDDFFLSGKIYSQRAGGADIAIADGFPRFFKCDGEIGFSGKDQLQFSCRSVLNG